MKNLFEELDFRKTPLGELILRRRRMPDNNTDIYEVKLGKDFLMTSLFHEAESQLARLGLAAIEAPAELDIVVGGLGLGYTAAAALEDSRVRSLVVVETLPAVIDWHQRGLVPLGLPLTEDPRCRFLKADFFALARSASHSFNPERPDKQADAILLDVDHTPTNVLHPSHAHFYTTAGLTEMRRHLKPNGVFALWADGEPDEAFAEHLRTAFDQATAHTITFDNPITGGTSCGAVYVAT